ncbi:alpha/beta fold hydrolase [Cuneatibacter caecimuris]|uniref:Alpha-beta hydrolase superfamily lysophospholipase n=1 Tax=Cuneatibacter caecimuris TaxID=1796618 RepID=A0A4Q7PKM4_9FIRM|nr:alpha/beta fold hydrolase [Cuneatibacter caecimuris]RZT01075.1 alpha-beta hydrolase superfamily lysophospholipase [Cuneatibacter caecimuris]
MKQENCTLTSVHDGLPLSVLAVWPENQPKGIVQLVHGMAEHKERYLAFMEFLARNGFFVVIHDHRGHGKSVKSEEDLGYLYENGAAGLVEDTRQVTDYAKNMFPGLPLILMGHSMGSLVVRAYTKKYDDQINQLIVCGSPSENPAAAVWFGRKFAGRLKKKHGPAYKSAVMDKLVFGPHNKKFPEAPNAWICSVPEVVQAYNDSPLCGFSFTADSYLSLFDLMGCVYGKDGWQPKNPALPILFVSGSEDPCLLRPAKFKQAVELMKQAGYSDVCGRLYPGMRHEILNEAGKEKVFADLLEFMEKHL